MTPSSLSFQVIEPLTPWLVVFGGIAVLLAWRLYRDQVGGMRALFLALRAVAIGIVVFLLLDPVLSLFSDHRAKPRITLLVDHSLSMSIPFPEEELGEGSSSEGGVVSDEADAVDEETPPTRFDRALEVVGTEQEGLWRELRRAGDVDFRFFGGSVTPMSSEAIEDGLFENLSPEDRTDLSRGIADGVGSLRRRTRAIVLVSDGVHNVGTDPREAADRLGIPVYSIGVGQEGPISDVSVFDVAASGVAYLDNEVPVIAKLRARGGPVADLPVYLSEGDRILDSTRVSLPGGGIETQVDLKYVPTREGLHRYRVWSPATEGEISEDNNQHLFAVRVLKEKIRVLFVTSRPSFDATFLKRALESDISLNVTTVILSAARFPGNIGRRGGAFPEQYPDLAAYDLVILLDAGAGSLEDERLDQVARFVTERGGALLVMGPPRAFDLGGTQLASLLPVIPGRPTRTRTGQILPMLTVSGVNHPVTQLGSDPDENARIWKELPPLGVSPSFLSLKPNAKVLVQGAIDGVPRNDLPLIATSVEGRGRVLTIGGSPYWRWDLYLWGTGRSGDAFRRLVSRSVRWLVSRDELKQVMVRPSKGLFDGTEPVVVEGQVFDDDFRPVEGADVRATVRGPVGSEAERAREISLVDLGQGRYRGTVPGLPPGDYRIEGNVRRGNATLGQDETEMTVAPYQMEFEDPAPDFELLREISRGTGGRFYPLRDASDLAKSLQLEPVVERSAREFPFVENPLFLVAFLIVLGSEWALRRRRGLP